MRRATRSLLSRRRRCSDRASRTRRKSFQTYLPVPKRPGRPAESHTPAAPELARCRATPSVVRHGSRGPHPGWRGRTHGRPVRWRRSLRTRSPSRAGMPRSPEQPTDFVRSDRLVQPRAPVGPGLGVRRRRRRPRDSESRIRSIGASIQLRSMCSSRAARAGQQPERGARQVHPPGLPGRPVPRSLCSVLRHGDLSRAVFDAMNPRFDDFAADPEVRGPARQSTEDALRRALEYFLYRDLEHGWRVPSTSSTSSTRRCRRFMPSGRTPATARRRAARGSSSTGARAAGRPNLPCGDLRVGSERYGYGVQRYRSAHRRGRPDAGGLLLGADSGGSGPRPKNPSHLVYVKGVRGQESRPQRLPDQCARR